MSRVTLPYSGTLIATVCWCGIHHGVPEQLYDFTLRDHSRTIYCPLGHSWSFSGPTEAEKERQLRKRAEDEAAAERARADQAEASLTATKGVVTRMKRRAMAGACVYCHAPFPNLRMHMAAIHPDVTIDTDPAEEPANPAPPL